MNVLYVTNYFCYLFVVFVLSLVVVVVWIYVCTRKCFVVGGVQVLLSMIQNFKVESRFAFVSLALLVVFVCVLFQNQSLFDVFCWCT